MRKIISLTLLLFLSSALAQSLAPTFIELDVGRGINKINALVWAPKKNDIALLFFRGTPGKDAVVKIDSLNKWENHYQFLQPLINQLTFIPNKELWSQCRRPTVNYGSHRGIASLTRSMNCLRA